MKQIILTKIKNKFLLLYFTTVNIRVSVLVFLLLIRFIIKIETVEE